MRKTFKTDFDWGDEVFIKTLPDDRCIVTGFLLRAKGVTVGVQRGENEEWYEMCALAKSKATVIVKGFR